MTEPIMHFVKTFQRMEEDDPVILYHDRVYCTGETRQETYSRPEAKELRDQLDQILGDREDYKALRRDHAIMAQALSDNEMAAKALGIVEGDDFMLTIAQWAKSYRPPDVEAVLFGVLISFGELEDGTAIYQLDVPGECYRERIRELARRVVGVAEPSPDLKEAIGKALRSWRADDSMATSLGGALGLAFGFRPAKTQEELDRLAAHLAEALPPQPPPLTPEEAEAIRACAEAAGAWAPSRTADAGGHLVGQAELATAAADRLSGAAGGPESAEGPPVVTREQWERDTIIEGVRENRARLDKLESIRWPKLVRALGDLELKVQRSDAKVSRLSAQWGEKFNGLKRDYAALPERSDYHEKRIGELLEWKAEIAERVQALELHRAGLTDGQAEVATGATRCACGHPGWAHSPGCSECSCGNFRPQVEIVKTGEGTARS